MDGKFDDLVSSIFHFKSVDGLHWERDAEPAVKTAGPLKSVVYPFVLKQPDGWIMWYGCHVDGGCFEIYCSTSEDGVNWTHHVEQPAFPATREPNTFDGRYTSTPCVLEEEDRYLLYYSSRDCGHLYRSGDGKIRYDAGGIYRHIGVAVLPRS
jgi:hypothetical protein